MGHLKQRLTRHWNIFFWTFCETANQNWKGFKLTKLDLLEHNKPTWWWKLSRNNYRRDHCQKGCTYRGRLRSCASDPLGQSYCPLCMCTVPCLSWTHYPTGTHYPAQSEKQNTTIIFRLVVRHWDQGPGADRGFSRGWNRIFKKITKKIVGFFRPFVGQLNWFSERSQKTINTLFWQSAHPFPLSKSVTDSDDNL